MLISLWLLSPWSPNIWFLFLSCTGCLAWLPFSPPFGQLILWSSCRHELNYNLNAWIFSINKCTYLLPFCMETGKEGVGSWRQNKSRISLSHQYQLKKSGLYRLLNPSCINVNQEILMDWPRALHDLLFILHLLVILLHDTFLFLCYERTCGLSISFYFHGLYPNSLTEGAIVKAHTMTLSYCLVESCTAIF